MTNGSSWMLSCTNFAIFLHILTQKCLFVPPKETVSDYVYFHLFKVFKGLTDHILKIVAVEKTRNCA